MAMDDQETVLGDVNVSQEVDDTNMPQQSDDGNDYVGTTSTNTSSSSVLDDSTRSYASRGLRRGDKGNPSGGASRRTNVRSAVRDRLSGHKPKVSKSDPLPSEYLTDDQIGDDHDFNELISVMGRLHGHHQGISELIVAIVKYNSTDPRDPGSYDDEILSTFTSIIKRNNRKKIIKEVVDIMAEKTNVLSKVLSGVIAKSCRSSITCGGAASTIGISTAMSTVGLIKGVYYACERSSALDRIAVIKAIMLVLSIKVVKRDMVVLARYYQELQKQADTMQQLADIDKDPQSSHGLSVAYNKLLHTSVQLAERRRQLAGLKASLEICLRDSPIIGEIFDIRSTASIRPEVIDAFKEQIDSILAHPIDVLQQDPLLSESLSELIGYEFIDSSKMASIRRRNTINNSFDYLTKLNDHVGTVLDCVSVSRSTFVTSPLSDNTILAMRILGVASCIWSAVSSGLSTYLGTVTDNHSITDHLYRVFVDKILTLFSAVGEIRQNIAILKLSNSQVVKTGSLLQVGLANETQFHPSVQDNYEAKRRVHEYMLIVIQAICLLVAISDPASAFYYGNAMVGGRDLLTLML